MALLFVVPGFTGIWLPALGRGPTAEPEGAWKSIRITTRPQTTSP